MNITTEEKGYTPLMIAVDPNGARKTKDDHAGLPLSPTELAMTAAECQDAGACMIHLHVRDQHGGHSLDADLYREAIAAIRKQVGDELIIQITTEAVGIYKPDEQIQLVKDLRPEAISVALREICPLPTDESRAADFFAWLQASRIAPQYILYDSEDIKRFNEMQNRGIVPQESANVLLVLGRYTDGQKSRAEDLNPLLENLKRKNLWWLCAFGSTELDCMEAAMEQGGHCRIGFENNQQMADETLARNNAALVSQLINRTDSHHRSPVSCAQARELMEIWQKSDM